MSDQGEAAQRTDAGGETFESPTGPLPQLEFPGRLTFSDEEPEPVPAPVQEPAPAPVWHDTLPSWDVEQSTATAAADEPEPDWFKARATSAPQATWWSEAEPQPLGVEAPSFDGMESGEGQSNYAGVDMSGPAGPVKAGVPSSGNWRMPEWMGPEAGDAPGGGFNLPEATAADNGGGGGGGGGGKGKAVLFTGLAVLVVGAVAGGAVYMMKSGSGENTAAPPAKSGGTPSVQQSSSAPGTSGSHKKQGGQQPLETFPGTPTATVGRVKDTAAGLSYPKFAAPWTVPSKRAKGWTGQQVVPVEHHGKVNTFARLLSAPLPATVTYGGAGGEKAAAVDAEQVVEQQFYSFQHQSKQIASQTIKLKGKAGATGWLVADEVTYKRPGLKATSEIVLVAVVNTGGQRPGVLYMAVPDNAKKLYPDLNLVVSQLKLAH